MLKRYNYSIDKLKEILLLENPNLSNSECRILAEYWFKEFDKSNKFIRRNNKKYFKHNIPLSLFEDDNGEINLN